MPRHRVQYIDDQQRWPDDKVYQWKSCRGVAVRVYGWEAEPDISTDEDTGEEYWDSESLKSTGRIVVVMVGDDYRHLADPEDVEEIAEEDYCSSCGQIGCGHSLKGD